MSRVFWEVRCYREAMNSYEKGGDERMAKPHSGGGKSGGKGGSSGKGSGGWPSKTGNPSGGGRTNAPSKGKGK